MTDRLGWAIETADLFSATIRRGGEARRHLLVESLPDGGWDWSAWSADGSGRVMHGQADTAGTAMAAAERAAKLLDGFPVMDLGLVPSSVLNAERRRPN